MTPHHRRAARQHAGRPRWSTPAIALLTLTLAACERPDPSAQVTIFAAASTAPALEALLADDPAVRISAAGSGSLARQIELGAAADLYLSADPAWVTYLENLDLVAERVPLLGNTLVLATPAGAAPPASLADLRAGTGRIALGDPESVPAGRYAREILRRAGLWDELAPRLVYAGDVRQVLLLLRRREVSAGFLYASDLVGAPEVAAAVRFDDRPGGVVTCELALLRPAAERSAARALFEHLRQVAANDGFAAYGFSRPATRLPGAD